MVINRPLNKEEIVQLLNNAPESETRNLKIFLEKRNTEAYSFLNNNAVDSFGLIIDTVPVYFAYLIPCNDRYELWTVVNKDVKHQFSLFKHSKREINRVLEKFSPIFATMEKYNHKNIAWVEHLGFKRIYEDKEVITFEIKKGA